LDATPGRLLKSWFLGRVQFSAAAEAAIDFAHLRRG